MGGCSASSPCGSAPTCKSLRLSPGALAVVLGGDVFWSLIGLLIGQLLGGAIMALHAAQGPRWACRR